MKRASYMSELARIKAKVRKAAGASSLGSFFVDAACALPVFIISCCLLLFLIDEAGIEERTARELTENSLLICEAEALFSGKDDSGDSVLSFGLKQEKEQGGASLPMSDDEIFYAETLTIYGVEKTRIPGYIYTAALTFRPFRGESDIFRDESSERVYIFPKAGTKYHYEGCVVMQDAQIESILTPALRRAYAPCEICDPELLPDGSAVLIYSSSSGVYHRRSCSVATKTYEAVSLEYAVEHGYTECLLCGKKH